VTGAAATAAKAEPGRSAATPWAIHVALAAWIALLLGLALAAPETYRELVQEDRFIEWWTVFLFLAAAIALIRRALRQRRVFDGLVAAFCLFVAGEEFSWGQRLLGLTPPDLFLEHNTQQELTLHNFANLFGQPGMILMMALAAYGVVLPITARSRSAARLFQRLGASIPPILLTPWFLVTVLLLYYYPVEFTGEWVEAMAGGLFFASTRPRPPQLLAGAGTGALAAVLLTFASARGITASPAAIACARRETAALAADVGATAASPKLRNVRGAVHKRVWTALDDRYLHPDRFHRFASIACGRAPLHFIDPWGMAYWLRVLPNDHGTLDVAIYSMGPNRRRDHAQREATGGDDIIATTLLLNPH
jgi:hypothetical protein